MPAPPLPWFGSEEQAQATPPAAPLVPYAPTEPPAALMQRCVCVYVRAFMCACVCVRESACTGFASIPFDTRRPSAAELPRTPGPHPQHPPTPTPHSGDADTAASEHSTGTATAAPPGTRWSESEDQGLRAAVAMHGTENWEQVRACVRVCVACFVEQHAHARHGSGADLTSLHMCFTSRHRSRSSCPTRARQSSASGGGASLTRSGRAHLYPPH